MKILLKTLFSIFVLLLIIAIVAVVLLTRTPRQLKVHDKMISGEDTFETLGLADTKFLDMIKSYRNASNVKEGDIVKNPYDPAVEKQNAEKALEGSTIPPSEIERLYDEQVVYASKSMIVYKDATLAYMLNQTIANNASKPDIPNIGIKVEEITVTGATRSIRTIISIPVDVKISIPMVKIPEKLYGAIYLDVSGSDVGEVTVTGKEFKINDSDDPVIESVAKAMLRKHYTKDDGSETTLEGSIEALMHDLASVCGHVLNNLGKLGVGTPVDAKVDASLPGQYEIELDGIEYGNVGIKQSTLVFIGHDKK